MERRTAKPSAIPISPLGPAPLVTISDDNSRVVATLPAGDRLEVLLTGATILSWKTGNGRERLFLSDKAILDGSKGVRGGIPIVFPLFGPPSSAHPETAKLSQHGFARSSKWEYLGKSSTESGPLSSGNTGDTAVTLDFGLDDSMIDAKSKQAWPHSFGLTYSVTLSPGELATRLQVQNTGSDAWEFQALLHTYFAVSDIHKTQVTGLEQTDYADKTQLTSQNPPVPTAVGATQQAITFKGETDRIYSPPRPSAAESTTASHPSGTAPTTDTPADAAPAETLPTITIAEGNTRTIEIRREGLRDVVVWNPWSTKAGTMSDFGPADGWTKMVCVEAGSVDGRVKLEASEAWEGGCVAKAL